MSGVCPRSLKLLGASDVPVATVSPSGHGSLIDQPYCLAEILAEFLEGA